MILFRRVGESLHHIEDREWALLALETLGVVLGILIAFALQQWGQRRADDAKHHQLMERLFEESEMDVAVLRQIRDVLHGIVDKEKAFALDLNGGRCPPQADWRAVETIGMLPALTAPSSVYQELLGAGGLSSVQRRDVRRAIAQFHGELEWSQQQVAFFRQQKEEVVPYRDPRVTITYDPQAQDPAVTVFDREALCGDHAFKNSYAANLRQHIVFESFHQSSLEAAIGTCVRLGDSQGKQCVPTLGGALKGADATYAAEEAAKMRKELAHSS
jgi:hypothetical protein